MKFYKLIFPVSLLFLTLSCVQETHLKTIYLKVNMSNEASINNPVVMGQFTNPAWEKAIPLTDENNDGIYEAKVELKVAQFDVEFKFKNNDMYELQNQNNRSITFEYEPETFIYEAVFNQSEAKITKQ